MRRGHYFPLLPGAAWVLLAAAVNACPSCPSARAVQASVLDDRFWTHLFFTALPLAVLGLVVAKLYRIRMADGREGKS